jgi:hypothetical protein
MFEVFAAALISSPTSSVSLPADEHWPIYRDSIQRLAIQLEILDHRETNYIMAKKSDYETDINLLRRRYREFADVPRVNESLRLPDRQFINELIVFNRAFRRHLADRHILEQDRSEVLLDAIRETDTLYKVWDAARDARCEFYYITVRRLALKKLKDMIGDDMYMAVALPPNAPFWRFNELP